MDTKNNSNAQDEVIDFLGRSDAFGPDPDPVERIETHISLVFLGKARVFKLKRAITYPYLDFSTPPKRRLACEAEVRINRRTAPDLYRRVRAVVRKEDGTIGFGEGDEDTVLDWVVEMARFDQETLFDRLAEKGTLTRRLSEDLGDEIAAFHLKAKRLPRDDGHTSFIRTIEGNAETFEAFGADVFEMETVRALAQAQSKKLAEVVPLLDDRARGGFVRHCHGDLHLRNIFLDDGRPVLFDAIEFNTLFAEIDVLYDLSFLLMDIEHRRQGRLASVLMNRYLDVTGDAQGLGLFPLFLSLRAAIRAHVDATAAYQHSDPTQSERLKGDARAYLDRALAYLAPHSPRLVATGGLSGSGKSTVARELAPHIGPSPGARVVRTDCIRKRLCGVALTARLDKEGYAPQVTEKTYGALMAEVEAALLAGHSVIADGVFARPEERAAIEALAVRVGVPFSGLWLAAPPDLMAQRAETRTANVSDAGADVVRRQLNYDLGEMAWDRVNSSGSKGETLRAARLKIGL